MGRRITPVIAVLLCIYLDTIFFPRVNVLGMRPDAMLAATVSFGVLHGMLPGVLVGVAGGLVIDIIGMPAVGLSAVPYLVTGIASGFFYKKFYADNIIVPAATAAACGLMKDLFMAAVRWVGGARYPFLAMFVQYILPSALMSALICILFHLVLKPLAAKQVKRQHNAS